MPRSQSKQQCRRQGGRIACFRENRCPRCRLLVRARNSAGKVAIARVGHDKPAPHAGLLSASNPSVARARPQNIARSLWDLLAARHFPGWSNRRQRARSMRRCQHLQWCMLSAASRDSRGSPRRLALAQPPEKRSFFWWPFRLHLNMRVPLIIVYSIQVCPKPSVLLADKIRLMFFDLHLEHLSFGERSLCMLL